MKLRSLCLTVALVAVAHSSLFAAGPMKALIIDGQNNHGAWPKTTFMMKKYLEDTKLFTVDIARTAFTTNGEALLKEYPLEGFDSTPTRPAKTDPNFRPEFAKYDVVISNFGHGAAPWPKETQDSLVSYMKNSFSIINTKNKSSFDHVGEDSNACRRLQHARWNSLNLDTKKLVQSLSCRHNCLHFSPGS